jgi:hypothetical protein
MQEPRAKIQDKSSAPNSSQVPLPSKPILSSPQPLSAISDRHQVPSAKPHQDSLPFASFERSSLEKYAPESISKPNERVRSVYKALSSLSVSIPSCRLVSTGWFGSSSYVSYTINSKQGDLCTSIERRFSDIDWLHTQLTEKFKGLIIPPRPDKQYFGSTSEKFIEERRVQMEKYLELLAVHPILSNSPQLQCFLTAPTELFEREKEKLELSKSWMEFSSFEDTLDKLMANLHSRMGHFSSSGSMPYNQAVTDAELKLGVILEPTQSFSGAFNTWSSCRSDSVLAVLKLRVVDTWEFSSLIEEYAELTTPEVRQLKDYSMRVRDELLRVEGLKNAVESYKETRDSYAKHDLLEKRKAAKQRACSDEDSMARYLADVMRTQEDIKGILQQLNDIETNLENETRQFSEIRTASLTRTLRETTDFAVTSARRESAFWRKQVAKFDL